MPACELGKQKIPHDMDVLARVGLPCQAEARRHYTLIHVAVRRQPEVFRVTSGSGPTPWRVTQGASGNKSPRPLVYQMIHASQNL